MNDEQLIPKYVNRSYIQLNIKKKNPIKNG